jgi:hypothetical protein
MRRRWSLAWKARKLPKATTLGAFSDWPGSQRFLAKQSWRGHLEPIIVLWSLTSGVSSPSPLSLIPVNAPNPLANACELHQSGSKEAARIQASLP